MSVELTRVGDLALVTLNRPEVLNALSFDILRQIGAAFDEVAVMDGVRALMITGAGDKAFCAGADIAELRSRDLVTKKRVGEFGQSVFAKLDSLPIPSIALVNGYAYGGGCELALAATFRLASPNAVFGQPEVKLGLVPGYGGTQRLPRLIGEARAMEAIMTGRSIKAEEAERIGLVNAVVEGDLVEAGEAFAARFTRYSLPVLGFIREAVSRAGDTTLEEGLRIETDLSTLSFCLHDAKEGMAAFAEKRAARFTDG